MAGVPFEVIEKLATPQTIALARRILSAGGAANELRSSETDFRKNLEGELDSVRALLIEAARGILPSYFVFGSADARNLLSHLSETMEPRNNRARGREQHLLLYLQRVATKNDTFSEFGPSGWGKIDSEIAGVAFAPAVGIAA